jgi:sugar-specific transcriptional regulator TrmB
MTKPLSYYCSNPEDESIFGRIQEAIERMLSQHKLEIALLRIGDKIRPGKIRKG